MNGARAGGEAAGAGPFAGGGGTSGQENEAVINLAQILEISSCP